VEVRKIQQNYFFHGSATKLKVGSYLLPSRQTGAPAFRHSDRDSVYVTADLNYAIIMALEHLGKRGWLYRVEPIGRLEPHEETDIIFGFDDNNQHGSPVGGLHFTVEKAQILARYRLPAFFYDNHKAFVANYLALFTGLQTQQDLYFKYADPDEDPDDPSNHIIVRGPTHWRAPLAPTWSKFQNTNLKIVKVTKK
jgi:hypothetical protein